MIGLLVAAAALGCGGMFGPTDGEVFSDAQQVIFEAENGVVDVSYRVNYGGGEADFGWIVPVPGAFVSIDETSTDRFDDLRSQTDPRPTYHSDPAPRGCGPMAKGGADNELRAGGDTGLQIVASGRAGVFEYTAFTADGVGPITGWLDAEGWTVGPSLPSLQAYVDEGGWTFVAVSLAEDVPATGPGGGQTAVTLRYEGNDQRFPARMSQYSTAEEQATTVYVVGDQRAHAVGWNLVDLPQGDAVGSWSYEEVLRDALGGTATYAVVFADELDGQWVTRFDTIAASPLHDADPQFLLDGGIVSFVPKIDVYESQEGRDDANKEGGCSTTGGRVATVAWLLAALAVIRRRRQS